jgi:hypothetical protein
MIVRKADEIDPWTAEKAMANYYRPNSVVWYQKDENSQGWVYRAKSDYVKSKTPPDEDDKWVRDYSFYLPWKAGNKYEIGMRVYFFNGQRLYGYIASKRYFGGTGEPNTEVDEDGIRTWEIDFKYLTSVYYGPLPSEFLFPVKKRRGYIDGKINSFTHTDPEERPVSYGYYDSEGFYREPYGGLIGYWEEEGILSKDYKEFNSKFQSYAYDSNTYVFVKLTNNGTSSEHRKAGIHRAKFLKELNPKDPSLTYAESQSRWTYSYSPFTGQHEYFNPHGFSIEMWPTATDEDYELVPSYGFKSFGFYGGTRSGYDTQPRVSGGIRFPDPYFYFSTGVSFNGDMTGPDHQGTNYQETPDEYLKLSAYFDRNCPAFDGRVMTINLLKTEEYSYWDSEPQWCYNEDTKATYQCGVTWVLKRVGYEADASPPYPWLSFEYIQETIDSYEESYKWGEPTVDFLWSSGMVRNKDENPIDFNKYKKRLTSTSIGWVGDKWE